MATKRKSGGTAFLREKARQERLLRDREALRVLRQHFTGYEAKDAGIAFEVLMDSATGGEQVFFLNHGQPVAKAIITTKCATRVMRRAASP